MSIDATVGGPSANSYISVSDANDYFDARVGTPTTWTNATTAAKEAALKHATRAIDTFTFAGIKYYQDTQALAFPRTAASNDKDANGGIWDLNSSGTVINPLKVQYACCECALWLMVTGGEEALSQTQQRGASSVNMGKIQYSGLSKSTSSVVGPEAAKFLRHYIARSTSTYANTNRFPDWSNRWE